MLIDMTITDFIKKKADVYCEDNKSDAEGVYNYSILSVRASYTSGFTEGVELMKGFFIWAALNQYRIEEDELAGICWYDESVAESLLLTTDELISEYIKTIK